ncbi:MAG: hypothetical protein PHO01_12630 [Desulfotomaculaceae bacterium]|nr:hypothetical protein [Desulfotomaculaceae bacterium]
MPTTVEKHHGRIASFSTIAEAEQQAQDWIAEGRAEKVKVHWAEGRWWASETPKRGGAKIAGNNQS